MIKIQKYSFIVFLFLFTIFNFNLIISMAAPACDLLTGTSPQELIECASPDSLQKPGAPTAQARNLNEILNVINNTLAALAVFLAIIGAIVSSINIAKSQGAKTGLEDAKQMLTNSIMAFVIAITIWLIVGLVLRTTGLN
jgi:hypothetical protein